MRLGFGCSRTPENELVLVGYRSEVQILSPLFMLSENDGRFLLRAARQTIEKFASNERIEKPAEYPDSLDEKHGVFCTIHKHRELNGVKNIRTSSVHNSYELRGCIGVPYPAMALIDATISAASSACEDPRFPKLAAEDLDKIKIELSVLTEPRLIDAEKEDYLKAIRIGKDGLIINYGYYSGLLLPQVAIEQEWDAEEFLNHLCLKAGLLPEMWQDKNARIYRFQAQVFREE